MILEIKAIKKNSIEVKSFWTLKNQTLTFYVKSHNHKLDDLQQSCKQISFTF